MFTVAHQAVIQNNDKKPKKEKQTEEIINSKNSPLPKNDVPEKKKTFVSTLFQCKNLQTSKLQQTQEAKASLHQTAPFQGFAVKSSQQSHQKIKFKVLNGKITNTNEKPSTNSVKPSSAVYQKNHLSHDANKSVSNEQISSQNAQSHPSQSTPIFTTSPFVTFSSLNAKNLISQKNQNSSCKNKNTSDFVNHLNSNSTVASTPTNMDCSNLDKSLNSSRECFSNHLTRASTQNSVNFSAGVGSDISICEEDKGLHNFKEKNNNKFTSKLINGNSINNKIENLKNVVEFINSSSEISKNSKKESENFKHLKSNFNPCAEENSYLENPFPTTNSQQNNSLNGNNNNQITNSTTICLNLAYLTDSLNGLNANCHNGNFFNDSNNFSANNNMNNYYNVNNFERKKLGKKHKEMRIKNKRLSKEGSYNCGRWQPEEHQRFIEAIMKYGNEWKQVQKHVGTRSSTQARSHAQKFFVKIKKSNVLHLNIDLSKNSIKTLHELANNLTSDEYFNAIKALNCVAFERKTNNSVCNNTSTNSQSNQGNISGNANHHGKRKAKKEESNFIDLNNFFFSDLCGNFNIITNNEDNLMINGLNVIDNTNIFGNFDFKNSKKQNFANNIKIISNDFEENKKNYNTNKYDYNNENNFIIINNNTNNYNYNISYNSLQSNNINNFNYYKNEQTSKKRNRFSSFEGIFPYLEKESWYPSHKKSIDDSEILNNFCANIKFENFINDEDDLENLIFMTNSNSESDSKDKDFLNKKRTKADRENFYKSQDNEHEIHKRNIVDTDVEDIFIKFLDVNE